MTARADRIQELADRRLSPEELDAWVGAPMTEDEREEIRALIEWFCRRYATPLERLVSSRRAWEQAERRRGIGSR